MKFKNLADQRELYFMRKPKEGEPFDQRFYTPQTGKVGPIAVDPRQFQERTAAKQQRGGTFVE